MARASKKGRANDKAKGAAKGRTNAARANEDPAARSIDEIGERDGWRCWLCDEPVEPERSVNDDLGPSIDSRITRSKAKTKSRSQGPPLAPRLAHRACNTGKGARSPEIAWPTKLFVADAAVIITSVERLTRKGGREAMGRFPTEADAQAAASWLRDRVSRLEPSLDCATSIEPGGGQYLLLLHAT